MTVIARKWKLRAELVGSADTTFHAILNIVEGPWISAGEEVEVVPAATLAGAVDLLRFYAEQSNWGSPHEGTNRESVPGSGTPHLSFSYAKPMAKDLGQRARDFLGGSSA